MATETTVDDVLATFMHVTSPRTRQMYESWRNDDRYRRVVPVVEAHRTRVLYRLTPEDVEQVCHRTEHALGDVKRRDIDNIVVARDWNPDFAFTHILHYCMEESGKLPTWQEFRGFIFDDADGWEKLGKQIFECRRSMHEEGVPERLAADALRWRVGNSYYGVLRDIYTLVHLRDQGLDVRSHPLADALFRVDAWVGRTVLSLRVGNPKFRDDSGGRKTSAEEVLRGIKPPFEFEPIQLRAAEKFGVAHLPSAAEIAGCAEKIAGRESA